MGSRTINGAGGATSGGMAYQQFADSRLDQNAVPHAEMNRSCTMEFEGQNNNMSQIRGAEWGQASRSSVQQKYNRIDYNQDH